MRAERIGARMARAAHRRNGAYHLWELLVYRDRAVVATSGEHIDEPIAIHIGCIDAIGTKHRIIDDSVS